jgi:hypothetical protein
MYSTQAWAAHYGLPLNTPDEFVQGYVDAMRMDAKGQGKPCGRGFIAPGKKCGTKGRQQLASDLKAGDAKAKARVATGKRNAMAQQKARRIEKNNALVDRRIAEETQKNAERNAGSGSKPKRPKPKVDRFGRTPKQQYKQAKSAVRELKMRGVEGAPLRKAEAEVTKLEKKFNPMVPRKKRSPESIAKGKETRARNKKASKKAGGWVSLTGEKSSRYGQGFDLEG